MVPTGETIVNAHLVEWVAAVLAMAAALLIAGDWGRYRTGLGFVLFGLVSILWIAAGLYRHDMPLVAQNAILLGINGYGVWRYLISPRETRVIEKMEQYAEVAVIEVEQELAGEGKA